MWRISPIYFLQMSHIRKAVTTHFYIYLFDCPWAFLRRRKWQPTPVSLPGESQGQRSLVGCRLWGPTESDTTEATWRQQSLLNCWIVRLVLLWKNWRTPAGVVPRLLLRIWLNYPAELLWLASTELCSITSWPGVQARWLPFGCDLWNTAFHQGSRPQRIMPSQFPLPPPVSAYCSLTTETCLQYKQYFERGI